MNKEIRKLIASYLLRIVFIILPDCDFKQTYSLFILKEIKNL